MAPHSDPEQAELLAELEALETSVWDALVRGDKDADENALDDAFLGVYPSGFANKADHIQQLANGPTLTSYELTDLRVLSLGDAYAVLSYRADFLRKGQSTSEAMYVSSIWKRNGQAWSNVFSQDTPTVS